MKSRIDILLYIYYTKKTEKSQSGGTAPPPADQFFVQILRNLLTFHSVSRSSSAAAARRRTETVMRNAFFLSFAFVPAGSAFSAAGFCFFGASMFCRQSLRNRSRV